MAVTTTMCNRFKEMSISNSDINILLMGETGVGKSTFVNAFANYLEYDKFEIAEKKNVHCLIPSQFTVTDEEYNEKIVKIGKEKNENEDIGESATQGARSYVFPIGTNNARVRLIDTPGIGDTRGVDQDNVNFENILNYISHMTHLHAICFLLKPNNSRLTVMFEYCIKQLLSRLEKSASKNIIFLFTNSRSTFYRPGDTGPALKKILEDIKSRPPYVNIDYKKENIYCLDNESFRFMVACKNKIKFTNSDRQSFSRSWDQSVSECWRLINYVSGEDSKTKLIPHEVQNTVSVNEARKIIIQLSKPLADIAELINDNITLLEKHKITLQTEHGSLKDLKGRLYVPIVNLRQKELKQPTTVCTNATCCEIYSVASKQKYHYKQRCHDPCYLQNVPREIIGSPELIHCYAINNSTKKCNECDCDFSSHMHVYYLTETYEDKLTDDGIQSQITDRETAVAETKKLIRTIESRKHDYEKEKVVIVRSLAKFAHFLKNNAIAPYNDSYAEYIEYLINREKSRGEDADTQLIQYYGDLLKQYNEEKVILDDAMKIKSNGIIVTVVDIVKSVKDLIKLKFTGKKIAELQDKQTRAQNQEFESNTEFVATNLPRKNINTNKKQTNAKINETKNKKMHEANMQAKCRDIIKKFPEMKKLIDADKYNSNNQNYDQRFRNDHRGQFKAKDRNQRQYNQRQQNDGGNFTQQGHNQRFNQDFDQNPRNYRQHIHPNNEIPQNYKGPYNTGPNRGPQNFSQRNQNQSQRVFPNQRHPNQEFKNQPFIPHNQRQNYNQDPRCFPGQNFNNERHYNEGHDNFNPSSNYNQNFQRPNNFNNERPYNQDCGNFNPSSNYNQNFQRPDNYNLNPNNSHQEQSFINQRKNANVNESFGGSGQEGYIQRPSSNSQGQFPNPSYNQSQGPNHGQFSNLGYNQGQGSTGYGPNQSLSSGSDSWPYNQIPNFNNQRQGINQEYDYNQQTNFNQAQSNETDRKFYNQRTNYNQAQGNETDQKFYNQDSRRRKSIENTVHKRPMGLYNPEPTTLEFEKLAKNSKEYVGDYDYKSDSDTNDPDDEDVLFKKFSEQYNLNVSSNSANRKYIQGGNFRGRGKGYGRGKPRHRSRKVNNEDSDSDSSKSTRSYKSNISRGAASGRYVQDHETDDFEIFRSDRKNQTENKSLFANIFD